GRGISRLGSQCGLRDAWRSRTASGGVILATALGTGGSLATFPGILSRSITRDTWHSPKVSPKEAPKGAFVGASGHVACSEGLRRGSFGRACSDGFSKEAFGGASGHVACSKGRSEGSRGWALGGVPKGVFRGGIGRWI